MAVASMPAPARCRTTRVGGAFSPGKHEHAREGRIAQHRRERIALPTTGDEDDPLLHPLDRRGGRRDDDLDQVGQVSLGQGVYEARRDRERQHALEI
jgi:hypothetical protein